MAVELVRAHAGHVGTIAARMRNIDRMETEAFGRSPKQALRLGIRGSTIALTAKVDGRPEAMMGLVPVDLLSGKGTPWFLGTDEVYRHGREMIAWGPQILAQMLAVTPHLENHVASINSKAIRLLRAWGFAVEREANSIGGVDFFRFHMGREECVPTPHELESC